MASQTWGVGGPRPPVAPPTSGLRKAIVIHPIPDEQIHVPGANAGTIEHRTYGCNVSQRLISLLMASGAYQVILGSDWESVCPGHAVDTPEPDPDAQDQVEGQSTKSVLKSWMRALKLVPADPIIIQWPPIASAEFGAQWNELSFVTGEKANRTFYGFAPVAGAESVRSAVNEFIPETPQGLRALWFGPTFGDGGQWRLGQDLASTLNFDVLWAAASLKWSRYEAVMAVAGLWQAAGQRDELSLRVKGSGFYFELATQFRDVSVTVFAGARKAFLEAFDGLTVALAQGIAEKMASKPLLLYVTRDDQTNSIYASGGQENARLKAGQRFYSLTAWQNQRRPAIFVVDEAYTRISKLRLDLSTEGVWSQGDVIASLSPGESVPPWDGQRGLLSNAVSSQRESPQDSAPQSVVELAPRNSTVPPEWSRWVEPAAERFLKGLLNLILLPMRIARYVQYDQDFSGGDLWQASLSRALELARNQWALQRIKAPDLWPTTMGSTNTIVAVVGTGIDYNHQDLRRNIYWDGRTNSPGYDFFSHDPRPFDDLGQGTAVAGVIAGGGWQLMGAAPRVTLLPVKVMNSWGDTSSAALAQGLQYAANNGARILVIPWATALESQALANLQELNEKCLVVAAAGDEGLDLNVQKRYPASYSPTMNHVISVAATGVQDNLMQDQGDLHLSSNFGTVVDLAAPGADLETTYPRQGYGPAQYSGVAAGYVAAAAALLLSLNPEASPEDLKEALLDGASRRPGLEGQVARGRFLNVFEAFQLMKSRCQSRGWHCKL